MLGVPLRNGKRLPSESHHRAAEFQELIAHTPRVAGRFCWDFLFLGQLEEDFDVEIKDGGVHPL